MKESIINKNMLRVMWGFLFIGGGVALLGIYRTAMNSDHPHGYLVEENDGETFVYAAHA
jgi:hypothetical protein